MVNNKPSFFDNKRNIEKNANISMAYKEDSKRRGDAKRIASEQAQRNKDSGSSVNSSPKKTFFGSKKSTGRKTFIRTTKSPNKNRQYVGCRMEALSYAKLKKSIHHDLRFHKPKSWHENEQNSVWIRTDNNTLQRGKFGLKNKKIREMGEAILDGYENTQKRHSNLYYANSKIEGKPQSLNKRRVHSKNEGILYFSESINDLARYENREAFEVKVKDTIDAIVKKHNSRLDMITIHYDEYKPVLDKETKEPVLDKDGNPVYAGNVHAHFIMDNFDEKGNALGYANDSKVGVELQTLVYEHWKDWGFHRGETKSEISRGHLNPYEYGEYKDAKRKVEKLKAEVEVQTTKLEKAFSLKQRTEENLDEVLKEFKKVVIDMAQLEQEMSNGKHRSVGSLIQRAVGYGEDGKSEKFKQLTKTIKNKYLKMEKKYARLNNETTTGTGRTKNKI